MKIIRNGIDIELTAEEMYEAHKEYEAACLQDDIESRSEDIGIFIPADKMRKVILVAAKTLEHNDSYYESYWLSIDSAIKEVCKNV